MQTTFPPFATYLDVFTSLSTDDQRIAYQDLQEESIISPHGLRYHGYPFTADDCRTLLKMMEGIMNPVIINQTTNRTI